MKNTCLAVAIVLTSGLVSHGQVTPKTPGWFEFDVPALAVPDGGVVDLSHLNAKPISGPGFVAVSDGHFVDASGHRLRLFGTNITEDSCFPDEDVAPNVTLLSPNGGELLFEDNVHTIEWTATDGVAVLSVDIELSIDGGSSFAPIATGVANLHSYDWVVDDLASDSCVIRLSAVDPSGNVGSDESDSVFSIAKVTDVTSRLPLRYALHPAVPKIGSSEKFGKGSTR